MPTSDQLDQIMMQNIGLPLEEIKMRLWPEHDDQNIQTELDIEDFYKSWGDEEDHKIRDMLQEENVNPVTNQEDKNNEILI